MSADLQDVAAALERAQQALLLQRNEQGAFRGHLSDSALSTATALVALHAVDHRAHTRRIEAAASWLEANQNQDGGWGDTTLSGSNLSTTLLVHSALLLVGRRNLGSEAWVRQRVGSLEPEALALAVIGRYGRDRTFSVPILMLCAHCGFLGPRGWDLVLALPYELAALPRSWFGAIGLPVVSYALPALIAIGRARQVQRPGPWWSPLRWIRHLCWEAVSPLLWRMQPSSGGYLEATPLTSFVLIALINAQEGNHPALLPAVRFLCASQRDDGAWPIDSDLATWGTTLACKALGQGSEETWAWLLGQQSRSEHPFTGAAPGAWAWTDLPGGVPDADDTSGALIALRQIADRPKAAAAATQGLRWLRDLQNRDGGIPTFCRGWGALPFDRSTPEITAHALLAMSLWRDSLRGGQESQGQRVVDRALRYLQRTQAADGSWLPLWFGNEAAQGENNPVYGTAAVLQYLGAEGQLAQQARDLMIKGRAYLLAAQGRDGGFGGEAGLRASIEETAMALLALVGGPADCREAAERALGWLLRQTQGGRQWAAAPIGLYFARLWYFERLYPMVWGVQALRMSVLQRLVPR